ncbi:DUF3667 domain-containing protein [Mucilaginibacter sp. 14171R-50]|uniref:DUF3667 domain-containing protein n=1 Tax=Mucilaginibacter sp. 14171R-50 TaxID=2703789 RepID=UPI00138CA766|nr:DUF3667 domain-containing protein [Mucilaginibacter sp. 14171R-50]QHS55991.1 DUF3667 domain-containing protein [Mucilaginibacter sp. 14171R-50]
MRKPGPTIKHNQTDRDFVNCASCGHIINGNYCNVCGEKVIAEHDFVLKHYVEESFEGLTHFDTKFFRSVKVLILKPGMLTVNFSAGKRVNFVKPFQLFLICNLIFFLLAGKLNIFSQSLWAFYDYKPYTYFNTKNVILAKATNNKQFEKLTIAFNEHIGTESKLFIVLFIPVLAAAFAFLFINRKKYFSEHLVFATHYFSFILIYYAAFTTLISTPFYAFNKTNFSASFDALSSLINLIVFGIYLGIAARRFYKTGIAFTVAAALFTVIFFTTALYGYRILLFYKTIYGVHIS